MARSRDEVLKTRRRLEALKTQQANKLKLIQAKIEKTETALKQMLQKEGEERVRRIGEMVLKKVEADADFKSWLIEKLGTSLNPEADPWVLNPTHT